MARLLSAINTFFQASNAGNWSAALGVFLKTVCSTALKRELSSRFRVIQRQASGHGSSSTTTTPATSPKVTLQCPFNFEHKAANEDLYTGVYRITRHPGLWALGFFGLGTAALTPFLAEVAFFSMPAVFALVGGAHQVCLDLLYAPADLLEHQLHWLCLC